MLVNHPRTYILSPQVGWRLMIASIDDYSIRSDRLPSLASLVANNWVLCGLGGPGGRVSAVTALCAVLVDSGSTRCHVERALVVEIIGACVAEEARTMQPTR